MGWELQDGGLAGYKQLHVGAPGAVPAFLPEIIALLARVEVLGE